MESIYENDKKYILNLYNRLPLEIKRAEGVYLYDKDDNRYLDMSSEDISVIQYSEPTLKVEDLKISEKS